MSLPEMEIGQSKKRVANEQPHFIQPSARPLKPQRFTLRPLRVKSSSTVGMERSEIQTAMGTTQILLKTGSTNDRS